MGSRGTRILRSWPLLFAVLLALAVAPGMAQAQISLIDPALAAPTECVPPGPGTAANFAIDGLVECNGTADDWFSVSTCVGVLLNSPFGDPNPLRLPSQFERDSTANSIGPLGNDITVFSGTSNKNDDLIGLGEAPWTWDAGSVPQKDDLTEIYLHSRTDINGHIWIMLGNAHRSTSGDKHTDYEFNIAGITQTGTPPTGGQLIGNGPDGGRTANKDFVITVDYVNGGSQACVGLRRWNGTAYDSIAPPAGTTYSAVNQTTIPVPGDVIGTSSTYSVAREYDPEQFVEVAVDITALLPDINASDLCKPTATVLVKTRSSQSFTAELKDFALVHFNIVTPPSVTASNDGPGCVGGTVHLSAVGTPSGGSYAWTGPNGFTATGDAVTLTPLTTAMAGKYFVTYTTPDQCFNEDSTVVVVNEQSTAAAGPDSAACSANGVYTFVAHGSGSGGTPSWSVVSGTATINPTSGSFTPTVTVTGSATIRLTVPGTAPCPNATEDVAFTVSTAPTANAGADSTACSANGIYTFVAHGTGANGTPSWSVVSGTATINPTSGSLTPTVTVTGSATIRLTVTGDATCPTATDNVSFTVNTAPTAAAGPDSSACSLSGIYTFVAHGSGTGSPSWSVISGTATINPTSGSFTPTVTVTGSATIRLTTTGAAGCPPATEDVAFTVSTAPTALAGPDSTACSANGIYTFVAHGSGTGGTPSWSVISGTATINPTSGSFTPTVTVTGSATIRLTVTSGSASCPPASEDVAFVVNTAPTAAAGPDSAACSLSGIYTFVAHGSGTGSPSWSVISGTATINPTTGSFTPKVTVTGSATIRLTTTGAAGCPPATEDVAFTVYTTPTANAGPDTSSCVTTPDNLFKLHGTATNAVSVLWEVIQGTATLTTPTAYTTDLHTTSALVKVQFTATGQAGCSVARDTVTLTINPLPTCTLTAPNPLPQCASPGNQLCATNLTNAASYLWSLTSGDASWQITGGQGTDCVTYTAGNGGTEGTFKLVVTSSFGCKDSCTVTFGCIASQYFCTLTQGAYGNPNGLFNGLRRLALIQSLITPSNPLVVGIWGTRAVKFEDGSEQCIIDRLPAGGTPTTLPSGLGSVVIDPTTCQTTPALPIFNGKFRNVFLGQVITLSLNTRLGEGNLSGLTICRTMKTVRAIPGPGGDPIPDPSDTGETFTIPARIFTALTNLSLPKTVGGLLTLANMGLAGMSTDAATIGDLNNAVSAINEGFDECRFVVQCLDGETSPIVVGGSGEATEETIALPKEFGISASAPNPFSNMTTLRLSLPERSGVTLSVYNILGQEVARLADGEFGAGVQTLQWNAASRSGSPVAPGVYFFRVRANGLETGRAFTRTQKVLFIR